MGNCDETFSLPDLQGLSYVAQGQNEGVRRTGYELGVAASTGQIDRARKVRTFD